MKSLLSNKNCSLFLSLGSCALTFEKGKEACVHVAKVSDNHVEVSQKTFRCHFWRDFVWKTPNLSAWMSICNRLITYICFSSSCFDGELSRSCSCLPAIHETQKASHLYPSYTGVFKQVRAGFLSKSCLTSNLFSLLFPFLFAGLLLAKCFFYCTNKCTHTFLCQETSKSHHCWKAP